MSPEVHQVSRELRAYIDRQPEGEVKRIAGNIAANLSTLDKFPRRPRFPRHHGREVGRLGTGDPRKPPVFAPPLKSLTLNSHRHAAGAYRDA